MVVAMTPMGMVQMAGHQIIDMVTMRNCFVAAVRTVNVARRMRLAFVAGGTFVGVGIVNSKGMLIVVVAVPVMEVAVVKIIDVILMQ